MGQVLVIPVSRRKLRSYLPKLTTVKKRIIVFKFKGPLSFLYLLLVLCILVFRAREAIRNAVDQVRLLML